MAFHRFLENWIEQQSKELGLVHQHDKEKLQTPVDYEEQDTAAGAGPELAAVLMSRMDSLETTVKVMVTRIGQVEVMLQQITANVKVSPASPAAV